MYASHKIRIYPNKDQIIWLRKACGASRFTYNWGLDKWKSMYEEWKLDNDKIKPNRFIIEAELHKVKHQDFKWITEVSDQPAQSATTISVFINKALINFATTVTAIIG